MTTSIISGGPSFVTFTLPDILKINPALTDVGKSSVKVKLDDGIGQKIYTLVIVVSNTAP